MTLDDTMKAKLVIDEAMHQVASEPAFARGGTFPTQTAEQVFRNRVFHENQVTPTFMAR